MTNSAFNTARNHARSVIEQFSHAFHRPPVNLYDLAKSMNVRIVENRHPGESWFVSRGDTKTIFLSSIDKSEGFLRYNLAHEIGHAYLNQYYPKLSSENDLKWQEQYAITFSLEILIPRAHLSSISNRLLGIKTPQDWLVYPKGFEVPVWYFFRSLSLNKDLFRGWNKVLFLARWSKNLIKDGRETYRIFYPTYDAKRFYIPPSNKSVNGFIKDSSWVKAIGEKEFHECQTEIVIQRKSGKVKPKYEMASIGVDLKVFRLAKSTHQDHSPMLFLMSFLD
ncbi:ImmA/IrrE family metallo-endopeptidase [Roseivirga pacifica]|uniref:ImmA/IrrE family metallo-endopeptidase n=1 Tax=Roseivirga pacifica TaxID=1267423 RepID=UPI003BAB9BF6